MFEDRSIQIKAYNLNTILAEKIESILARNIANTRARDYYDVYILLTMRSGDINRTQLLDAIAKKAQERGPLYISNNTKNTSPTSGKATTCKLCGTIIKANIRMQRT